MNLENKNILITGASSGIGKALALNLANHSCNLVLLGRNEKKLNQVYDEIQNINSNNNHSICCFDLAKTGQNDYENLQNSLSSEYGSLDIVFNNAAILEKICPIELYEPYLWFNVIQVNLNASFLLTHYLLPLIKKSQLPQIWFMSSSVADNPRANWGAYSVSKAAQDNFMKVLAEENKTILANSINPGATRTKMRAIAYPFENQDELTTSDKKAKEIIALFQNTNSSGKVISL